MMIRYLPVATLFVALFLLAGARALEAQRIPSPYRFVEERHAIGPFAGYLTMQGVDPDLGPRAAPLFGVRYNYRLGGPVDAEAAVGLAPSERTVFAARGVDPNDPTQVIPEAIGTVGMPLVLAEAGLRLNVTGPRTWNGLMPYLAATGGLVANLGGRLDEEEELGEAERFTFGPGFAVRIGAGTDWFLSDRLSLRAEIRNQIWRVAIPAGLAGGVAQDVRWTNNIGLSVGTALHF